MYNLIVSINEEIEKQSNFSHSKKETEEDKSQRIANIVFSQLLPITDNMLGFKLDKNKIKEIITVFSNIYNIPEDLMYNVIKLVDDHIYESNIDLTENNLDNITDIPINEIDLEENSNNEIKTNSEDDLLKQDKNTLFKNENEKQSEEESNLYYDNLEKYYDIIEK
jgi:hypothetical protein